MSGIQARRVASGKIGELLVELELTNRGWHVERLDGAARAANGDLIAIQGNRKFVIQVKTNGTQKDRAFLGYAGRFLDKGTPFFNAKDAPIVTDIVVAVTGGVRDPSFFVFTVEEAEAFAREDALAWSRQPTRRGAARSRNFPVSPKVERLLEYQDAWEKLETA